MDEEHEGTKNPLDSDDAGELEIEKEETDFAELANERAKEAMEQLESMRYATREAKKRRKEAWEEEHKGTIHLSDEVEMSPEMLQQIDESQTQFGQPMNGAMGNEMGGSQMIDPMQQMASQQMPEQMGLQMNGAMAGSMNGQMPRPMGNPQMVGQMGVVTNLDGTVPIASLDPTSRPMKQIQTVVVQKPKKLRKGWLVAISVSAFVAVATAVLAVLIIANTKPDTLVKALEQITTKGLAENITIDGGADLKFKDGSISSLAIDLEGSIKTTNLENTMTVKMVADMKAGDKLGVEANEVYARNDGVYLKLDKADALLKGIRGDEKATEQTTDKGTTDETKETAAEKAKAEAEKAWNLLANIIAKTDGKWLRLNSSEADTSGLGDAKGGACEASLANNLIGNQATIGAIYRTYPFLSSTTKGAALAPAQNDVYKVNIDTNNLISFFNGIEDMKSLAAYEECRGLVQPAIVGSNIAEIFKRLDNVYVEISDDYLITRVYFEYTADWGEMVADFYLSYPETVKVEIPEDTLNLSQVIKEIEKK